MSGSGGGTGDRNSIRLAATVVTSVPLLPGVGHSSRGPSGPRAGVPEREGGRALRVVRDRDGRARRPHRRASRAGGAAERLGYESVWVGEHVVLIDPQAPPSPQPPTARMLDPLVVLPTWPPPPPTCAWARGSSCCRSATRSCWPSSWPASTCCRRAASSSASASATCPASSRPSACRSTSGAGWPTRPSTPCAASGATSTRDRGAVLALLGGAVVPAARAAGRGADPRLGHVAGRPAAHRGRAATAGTASSSTWPAPSGCSPSCGRSRGRPTARRSRSPSPRRPTPSPRTTWPATRTSASTASCCMGDFAELGDDPTAARRARILADMARWAADLGLEPRD